MFAMPRFGKLSTAFREEFPTLPSLPRLLSHLSPNEPYSAIIPNSQKLAYLNALIWLLRHEVVAKQRTYVRVIASESVKRATTAHWDRAALQSGVSLASSSRADDASLLSTSAGATSDHSFGASSRRSDGKFPRGSVGTTTRLDVEDTKGMVIVSGAATGGGSPRDSPVSMSQKSASMLAARMAAARKRPGAARSHHSGSGYRGSKGFSTATMSSHSERPDEASSLPSVIVEPGRPSMLERRWLSEMCRDKDSADVAKFERYVPFSTTFASEHSLKLIFALVQHCPALERSSSPGRDPVPVSALAQTVANGARRVRRASRLLPSPLSVGVSATVHYAQSTRSTVRPTPLFFPFPSPCPHTDSTLAPRSSTLRRNSSSPPPTPK